MSLLPPIKLPVATTQEFTEYARTRPTDFSTYLGAKLQTGFDQSIAGTAIDQATGVGEGSGPLPQTGDSPETLAGMGYKVDQRRVTEDEWRKLRLDRPGLKFSGGGTVEYERARTAAFDERRYRDSLVERYQGGVGGQVAGFAAQMAGGLPSPENFVPFVGPGVRAAMVARLGVVGGHVAAGAADAAIGNVAADAITFPALNRQGEELGAADLATDITLGAVTGGLLGAGGGLLAGRAALRETANAVRVDGMPRQADAMELATQALVRDEPVDVGPVVGDLADVQRRMRRPEPRMEGVPAEPFGDLPEPIARDAVPVGEMEDAPVSPTANPLDETGTPEQSAFQSEITPQPEAQPFLIKESEEPVNDDQGSVRKVYNLASGGDANLRASMDVKVTGDTARIESIVSMAAPADVRDARGTLGLRDLLRVAVAISKDNPEVKFLTGERVTGIRVGGEHVAQGQGKEARIELAPLLKRAAGLNPDVVERARVNDYLSAAKERPPSPPATLAEAEARAAAPPKEAAAATKQHADDLGLGDIGKLSARLLQEDEAKAKAAETGVKPVEPKKPPEDIPEMQDVDALRRAGLLTAGDERSLVEADDLVKKSDSWATAYETLAGCVLRHAE